MLVSKNIVSAGKGPLTLYPSFLRYLIEGSMTNFSSLEVKLLSQCGFKPVTPIFGFLFKFLL